MKAPSQVFRLQTGVALVIVLAMLVLIAAAIVGFFARAITFRKASANENAAVASSVLADTAVNLVQAQIDHATTLGGGTAWASQPGAIRLFNNSGNLERIYRLYSAEVLSGTKPEDLASDLPPADWRAKASQWVDLNGPVVTNSGTRFPILDPRVSGPVAASTGFSIKNAPGATPAQPAPMPVRWLYMLQNGEVAAIKPDGTVPGAAAGNPIVGRIAFWTDDETCRVNVNTAAGSAKGSKAIFWDTPRFSATNEFDFGMIQPRTGEFQRYPGHPATTNLSKVFPDLTSQQLLALTPRFTFGGSEDATKTGLSLLTRKTGERLYASVGEMLFDKDRNPSGLNAERLESSRFFLTANNRAPELNLFGTPRVSTWPVHSLVQNRTAVDKLLAFSAQTKIGGASTANYYFQRQDPTTTDGDINLPRNKSLLSYLDGLTSRPIPGFGGSFSAPTKYEKSRRDILVKIFDYIRCINIADGSLEQKYWYRQDGVVVPAKHPEWNVQGFGRFPIVSEVSLWFVGLASGSSGASPAVPIFHKELKTGTDMKLNPVRQVGDLQPPYSGSSDAYWTRLPDVPSQVLDANGKPVRQLEQVAPAPDRIAVQCYVLLSFFTPSQGTPMFQYLPWIKIKGLENLTLTCGNETFPLGLPSYAQSSFGTLNDIWVIEGLPQLFAGANSFRANLIWAGGVNRSLPNYVSPWTGRPLGRLNPISNAGGKHNPFYSNILSLPKAGATMEIKGSNEVTLEIASTITPSTSSRLVYSIPLNFTQFDSMPLPTVSAGGSTFGLPHTVWPADKEAANDREHLLMSNPTRAILGGDVLWSLVPDLSATGGDYRMLSKPGLSNSEFTKHSNLKKASPPLAYSSPRISEYFPGATPGGKLVAGANYGATSFPSIPSGIDGVPGAGDWDSGICKIPDGAYINKADEGYMNGLLNTPVINPYFGLGYMDARTILSYGTTLFSPNRLMPSAGMFGSLPTGVYADPPEPWQTLLFRPGPSGHKGSVSPRDHLLADLFWMPVAEPYAISEPFSTNGKANLNYQIQPFTYINRPTALLSVLDSQRVAKVRKSDANKYKGPVTDAKNLVTQGLGATQTRFALNLSGIDGGGTLRQFEQKFAAGETFKSATEICDIFLVPEGSNWSSDSAARTDWYGDDFALVGDNVRERPYANLLSRVTTKSNTFTVYFTVQALKNPPNLPQGSWDESKGAVISEHRGSTTIERYIDPNAAIPDYAANPTKIDTDPLDRYYKWRIIQNSRFNP